ncbi:MAG TPA: hypothetical protein DC047_17290 [Blastocatellia bacterium]|nr:hypothetical protein [Blastocatellia bacterium]
MKRETMSTPTVSIILPVYNGENYLRLAIDSVLKQTFQDYELIVVDDGSVDSTPAIAREHGSRVRYVRQENTGVAGAFNHGLRLAAGRYISWLSHDDVFLPTKLERQVGVLESHGAPAVCYSDIEIIDGSGEVIEEQVIPEHDRQNALRHVLTGGGICSASYSVLYDRRCVEEVGAYDAAWPYTQDADMLARFARRFPLIRVPEKLMQVREHDNRGGRSKKWELEVVHFFSTQLNQMPLNELFPELPANATRDERASAYLWLAHTLAKRPFPYYRSAVSQYRNAIRERPLLAVTDIAAIIKLGWRSFRQHANRHSLSMKLKSTFGRRLAPS